MRKKMEITFQVEEKGVERRDSVNQHGDTRSTIHA